MNFLTRLIDACRRQPGPDPLRAVQPRVTPDPQHAAQLASRFAERVYVPENGFLLDQIQERVSP